MSRYGPMGLSRALVGALILILVGCQASAGSAPAARPAAGSASDAPSGPPPAAAATASAPAAAPADVIRIGDVRVLNGGGLYVAQEKGYFRAQHLDVRLEPLQGGADAVPFLATGDLDLALGNVSVGLFNAFDRGADVRIVAPAGILPLQDSPLPLMVRQDLIDSGAVRTPADLRGRRVAVNTRGGSVEYVLTKILDQAGLTIQDVEQIPVPFPDMAAALANGSIDAAIPAEPNATHAANLGVATKLVKEVVPGQMTTVIMASGKLVRERPDALRRWMMGYMQGTRDIQPPQLGVSDPALFYRPEHLTIFEKYTGAPEAVLRDQVPYTFDTDLVIQRDSIEEQQRVHLRNGLLTLAQPVPVEQMVDDSFVQYAQQQLGRSRQ